jgi:hypothetical protein
MRLPHRAVTALGALTFAAAAALAAQAHSNATTAWTRISGPTQPGVQLGLARTADGVLHVIWNRGSSPTSIFETRLSPVGKKLGMSTVATGFDGNGGLALLAMPDKTLRLFAAGATRPGSPAYGINPFTAAETGASWTLQNGAYWGGAVASSANLIGATLTKDGQAVTAWRGNAAEGVPPASIPSSGYEGGMTESRLATDAAAGSVVLSGVTNAGKGGVYVRQVLPDRGSPVVLPLPSAANDWDNGLSSRIGAPGVYVAYGDARAARLYRYGGPSKTLAKGPFTSATVCAGPAGRLWVAWGDSREGLFVTRSNKAAAAFEPVQKLKLPQNTQDGLTYVQCEGSAGPLDLFADVLVGSAGGFWHSHVLARLSLRAKAGKGKATLWVRDAGDPASGVTISVGSKRVTTDAKGRATLALRPGSYTARATAAGYAPASARFKVPRRESR